jgi:hypothetical protein
MNKSLSTRLSPKPSCQNTCAMPEKTAETTTPNDAQGDA